MKDIFIPTMNFQKTNGLVDDLLGPALGVEMAAVIAPAGRGKTFATERIYTQNKNTVYVLYQEKWSHIELMREITFQLSGTRPRLRQACFDILQDENRERRRLIMVDDADRMNSACLNMLRNIHDILKMPVLAVGEPPLERKILREKRLKSRTRNMLFYAPVNQADVTVFFKQAMGASLSPDQATRLLRHCEGDFRPLLTAAVKAEKIMDVSGIAAVTDKVVAEVCNNGRR
jgi:DNA transposition AAA+ family ATPase